MVGVSGVQPDVALLLAALRLCCSYCYDWDAAGNVRNLTQCTETISIAYGIEVANKAATGGGSFMTEFGAVGLSEASAQALSVWADFADTTMESWTYWSYKEFDDITTAVSGGLSMGRPARTAVLGLVPLPQVALASPVLLSQRSLLLLRFCVQNEVSETLYNADGSLQMAKLQSLSRTYAQAIACVPGTASVHFNTTNAAFTLTYTINASLPPASQYTTVYYNKPLWYPTGIHYTVSPPGAANVTQPEPNYLHIVHNPGATGVLAFNLSPSA